MTLHNTLMIAQKELADYLNSLKFRVLSIILCLILFSMGIYTNRYGGIASDGIGLETVQVIGLFFPILSFALGFDQVIMERKTHTLDTLVTHPVFYYEILVGKMIGGLSMLFLLTNFAIALVFGIDIVMSGVNIGTNELLRVLIFALISFIYLSTFFALGLLLSVICRDSTSAFVYGIIIWIVFVLSFGGAAVTLTSIYSGNNFLFTNNENAHAFYASMQPFSPTNHYSQLTFSISGMSQGNFLIRGDKTSKGIFDKSHDLSIYFNDYWVDLLSLILAPLLLIIASIVFFKID